MLATLGGEPEYCILLWNWEKGGKPVCSTKVSPPAVLSQCSFHPTDTGVLCVSGSTFEFWIKIIRKGYFEIV
jgi:hypothetical protein